jgi:hypothetical protein
MATAAVTPGQAPAADTRSVEQQIIDAAAAQAGTQAAQPEATVTLKIGGQDRAFKTVEELQAALSEYEAIQARQREELLAQAAQRPGQQVTAQQMNEAPKVDLNEFIAKMQKNPAEAMALVEKARYGVDNLPAALNAMALKQQQLEAQMAVREFNMQHPEFLGTDQNRQAIMAVMQGMNLRLDSDGLENAFAVAKHRNMLELAQPEEGGAYRDTSPYAPPLAPPRVSGRTQSPGPDIMEIAESLPVEQLEAIIRKAEAQGVNIY